MRIGIIGSGNIGGTLTRRFSELGHDVTVANSRGPESLTDLAAETGATAADVADAARDQDVVVVAVPMRAVPELPAEPFASALVVDATNYYPDRDGDIVEIADRSITSSRWVATHFPGARVAKAFNNIFAEDLGTAGTPAGDPARRALPVAGDDEDATATVRGLVDELGFDPVEAGTLDQSWRQQPGTPVYVTANDVAGVRQALAAAPVS